MAGLLLAALLLAGGLPAQAADQEGPAWLSYEQARRMGPKANKPLLLFFQAPWCYFCKELKRRVFSHATVYRRLNARFLPVLVDMRDQPRLAELYGVDYIPVLLFLDRHGKPVLRLKGYLPREDFLKALDYVEQGVYQRRDFETYLQKGP